MYVKSGLRGQQHHLENSRSANEQTGAAVFLPAVPRALIRSCFTVMKGKGLIISCSYVFTLQHLSSALCFNVLDVELASSRDLHFAVKY